MGDLEPDAWDQALDRIIDAMADDPDTPMTTRRIAELLGDDLLNETQEAEDWADGLRQQGYPIA